MRLKLLFLIMIVTLHYNCRGQNSIIATIAGNGIYGYNGDNISALTAKLNHPADVAIDRTGNVYICDFFNARIRKISIAGVITTIAGNGIIGYTGDGGAATASTMRSPDALAIDNIGNLYFCDRENQVVRKVDTSGIITTIAGNGIGAGTPNGTYSGDGGLATAAGLNNPNGIDIDTLGNIYIADQFNHRIRKVDTAGIIHTIAGTGVQGYSGDGGLADTAELYYPFCLAVDLHGNIYFTDNGNNRIRKINTAGIISTIAGNGNANSSGDGGQAILAGLQPAGIAVDTTGNIFVSENLFDRVRKINTNGIINTIAGTGVAGYNGDGGRADSAKLYSPTGIDVDKFGNLFIADEDNYRIRKIIDTTNHTVVLSLNKSNAVSLYPNPAKEEITIASCNVINTVAIVNVRGQTIMSHDANGNKTVLNIASLQSGAYFIKVSDKNGEVITRKFVKE